MRAYAQRGADRDARESTICSSTRDMLQQERATADAAVQAMLCAGAARCAVPRDVMQRHAMIACAPRYVRQRGERCARRSDARRMRRAACRNAHAAAVRRGAP